MPYLNSLILVSIATFPMCFHCGGCASVEITFTSSALQFCDLPTVQPQLIQVHKVLLPFSPKGLWLNITTLSTFAYLQRNVCKRYWYCCLWISFKSSISFHNKILFAKIWTKKVLMSWKCWKCIFER